MMQGDELKKLWQKRLMDALPPEHEVIERNGAITATYANWYYQCASFFQWSGAAAFASNRIGLALEPYEFKAVDGVVTGIRDHFGHPKGKEGLFDDLNQLRIANNEFFKDVGWAHLAYMAPGGGIEVIESAMESIPGDRMLLKAFRLIDEGRKIEASGNESKGDDDIWKSVFLIENHEQKVSVQPHIDRVGDRFEIFLSLFSSMNFEANNFEMRWGHLTWFYMWMWTRGLGLVMRTRALPDITRFDHRWAWTSRRVLPLWRKIEATDPHLRRNIAILIKRGSGEIPNFPRAAGAHQ